jgi:hypothetical protein
MQRRFFLDREVAAVITCNPYFCMILFANDSFANCIEV